MTEAPARLKPLKGEASRIFKLCLEKDPKTALQGLELAAALDQQLWIGQVGWMQLVAVARWPRR